VINFHDENDLTWYFSAGIAEFERSPFGSILDRQALFAFGSMPCKDCDGMGLIGINDCRPCKGAGLIKTRRHWNGQLTAKPKAIKPQESGYIPEHKVLTRFAHISRQLGRLTQTEYRSFAAFYGDMGARWLRSDKGRIFALYGLTSSGVQLLTSYSVESEQHLRIDDKIAVLLKLDMVKPIAERTTLIRSMDDEARNLFSRAAKAWQA